MNSNFEYEIFDEINEDLKKKIVECDAISIRTKKLSDEIISSAKKLKIISRHGVGYDNVGLKSTKEKNITLSKEMLILIPIALFLSILSGNLGRIFFTFSFPTVIPLAVTFIFWMQNKFWDIPKYK